MQGFNSTDKLNKAIADNGNQNLFSVLFHETEGSQLQYTIRNRNSPNLATNKIFRNNYQDVNNRDDDDYMRSGFVKLQVAINNLFLRHHNVTPFPVSIYSKINNN